jgi:hypothetical protein
MELVFLIAMGIVAAATVFLGVSNWFFLSSIVSKITRLEQEVEKKALEFEAARKERQTLAASARNLSAAAESAEAASSRTEDSQIQIVRNVRGAGFDHFDIDMGKKNADYSQPEMQNVNSRSPDNFATAFGESAGVAPPPVQQAQQRPFEPKAAQTPHRAPPTGARPAPEPGAIGKNVIVLTLFSKAKQDTDFASAWKKLSEELPGTTNPHVRFDFSGVIFLYERELLYLDKFKSIILQSGGSISFENCDRELLGIFQQRPALFAVVRP